jgi:hypothetical protein
MTTNPDKFSLSPVNETGFFIAWRVLTKFNAGQQPAPEDVSFLKQRAQKSEKRLRIDDLACVVMLRELNGEAA